MRKFKMMLGGICLLGCVAGGGAIATAGDDGVEPAPVPEVQ